MDKILYPMDFCRRSEKAWTRRLNQKQSVAADRVEPQGARKCICGSVITDADDAINSELGWSCRRCGTNWEAVADSSKATDWMEPVITSPLSTGSAGQNKNIA